jgi:DNA-binding NtrC family response regulator
VADSSSQEVRKVLIVDDDEDLLEMFEIILRKAGFYVEVADNGQTGIQKMTEAMPDVVVLDLMMPDCSGFDVLIRLQQMEGPKPVVIVVSGVHKDTTTVEKVRMEPVVFDFLFKPIKPKTLVDVVSRAIPARLP